MTSRMGWALVAALALAGCGSTPRESFYMLEAPAPLPATAESGPSIFVGPVIVPEAVDRTPMVVRTGPNQVDVEDFQRWAEPLKSAIPRVIAGNLMRELGTARIGYTRAASLNNADYRIAIEIQRFDSSLSEGATVEALWTIIGAKGGAPRTGRTLAHEAAEPATHAGIAAAHSRALAQVAKDIAKAMR